MKTFIPGFVIATTILASQALAGSSGPTMDGLTRTLSFPDQVAQPVTRDQTKQGK